MDDYVYQLAAPANFGRGGKICFAARNTGLFRSEDGGQSWQSLYDSLNLAEPLPSMAIGVPPNFERSPRLFAGVAGGILRSLDGGQSWQNSDVPKPPPIVAALAFSPNYENDGMVFAGTMEDGVIFTSNRGDNWVSWNFGLLDLNTLCLGISPAFANDETLFAGVQSGLFRSANGGRAWREVELPVGYEAILSLALSPNFGSDHTLFAGCETQGLLVSRDGGETWQQLGQDVFTDPVNAILLAADFPTNPEMLALHSGMILYSPDGGASWTPWREAELAEAEASALLAPLGFGAGQPVLVGLADGQIIQV